MEETSTSAVAAGTRLAHYLQDVLRKDMTNNYTCLSPRRLSGMYRMQVKDARSGKLLIVEIREAE